MKEKTKRTGRIPKLNPKTHCVMVRFDDEEHARFLTMYEQSGEYAKAVFIKARVFGEEFKVISRILRQTLRPERPIPQDRSELQPSCKGT